MYGKERARISPPFFVLQIHFHRFDIDGSLPSFPCLQPLLPLATSDQSVGFITPTHRAASVNYPALQSPIDHEIIAYNTMPKAPVVDHELVQRPLVLIYNVPILSSTCYPFVTTPLIGPFRSCVSVFLLCVFVCFYFVCECPQPAANRQSDSPQRVSPESRDFCLFCVLFARAPAYGG